MNPQNKGITKLPLDQRVLLVARYLNGEPSPTLSHEFGVSIPTVLKYVRMSGNSVRTISQAKRVYHCDDAFFERIDTQEKAYWLGFIAADGSVSDDRQAFDLALSSQDRDHLSRLLAAIDGNYPIHDLMNDGFPRSAVQICSEPFVRNLNKHGIISNKTYRLTFPELDPTLTRHYLRGYVDGDGSFQAPQESYTRLDGTRGRSLFFEMVSTLAFCVSARSFLCDQLGTGFTRLKSCGGNDVAYKLRLKGNRQLLPLVHFLYEGATIYLPRKRQLVLDHYRALPKYRDQLRFG